MKAKPLPINDINRCLKDAQWLAKRISPIRRSEQDLCAAFNALAGDETTGFIAYVIWRSRSQCLSGLR